MRNLFAICTLVFVSLFSVPAYGQRDNYPFRDDCPAAAQEKDPWQFEKCTDVSYVASRLNATWKAMHQAKPLFNNSYLQPDGRRWGRASGWKAAAQRSEIFTGSKIIKSKRPLPGDIAWFRQGHVAFVESVYSDGSVSVSEYGYGVPKKYGTRSNVHADAYLSILQHHEYCCREDTCLNFYPSKLPAPTGFFEATDPERSEKPDLFVKKVTLTQKRTVFTVGESFNVRVVVKNSSGSIDKDVQLEYWLSKGSKFSDATSLGTVNINKEDLQQGKVRNDQMGLTAPSLAGTYNIVVCADSANVIDENNEDNNCSKPVVFTVEEKPNLYISSLDIGGGKFTFSPKEKFLVQAVAKNGGGTTSRDVSLAYFLVSSGPVRLLKIDNLGKMAANQSMLGQLSYTAPSRAGNYYIMVCGDVYNSISETSESDNCYSAPFEVKTGSDPPQDPGSTIPYKEDFDTDEHYYELQDNLHSATMSIDKSGGVGNGRCIYLYNKKAGKFWQVEAKKKYFYLQNGSQYVGSIWLKADRPGKINLTLSREVEPYDSLGLYFPINLSTQWQQYSFDFKAEGHPERNPEQVRFSVNLGEYTGKLWIDKIALDSFTPAALPYFENFSGDMLSYKLLDKLGTASMTINSAGGVDNSRCLKAVNNKTGQFWQVQAKKVGLDLESGTTYTGRVSMRSDRPGKITLAVSREVEPYDNLGLYKQVKVTNQWKTFNFEFTTPASTFKPEEAAFQICMGLFDGKLYIDNVSIAKK